MDCGIQSEQAKDLYIDRYNISLYMVGKISEAGEFVSWNKKKMKTTIDILIKLCAWKYNKLQTVNMTTTLNS